MTTDTTAETQQIQNYEQQAAQLPAIMTDEKLYNAFKRMAMMNLQSGYFPKAIATVEQAMTIMLKGHEVGLPATEAMSKIYIVDGRPSMAAETMRALIYRRFPNNPDVINFDKATNEECIVTMKRPGGKPQTFSFSMEDAQTAGLTGKDNWRKHKKAMLISRATAIGARAVFADCLAGISHTPDELGANISINDRGETVEVLDIEAKDSKADDLTAELLG